MAQDSYTSGGGPKWTTRGSRNTSPADTDGEGVSGFFVSNRRIIIFSLFFFFGTGLGASVFALSGQALRNELGVMLAVHGIPAGLSQGISAFFSSCFSGIILLSILFISGLSACGVPAAAGVPFFFGLGVGMTQAYYYSHGWSGVLMSALLVTPRSIIAGIALIAGGIEAARMSLLISRQLLPSGAMGGLWSDFKIYTVRFLALAGISLAAAAVDVLLRLIILPLL